MITKNFLQEYGNNAVQTNTTFQSYGFDNVKKLNALQAKHCTPNDNHTPQLLSFVSAARDLGIDKVVVENYIYNNIAIAPNSSKAKDGEIKKLINDNYKRYAIGTATNNYTSSYSSNKTENIYTFKPSCSDVEMLEKRLSAYQITTSSNIPIPKPFISIGDAIIATAENILTISGLQKGGKTSFSNIILSCSISDNVDGIPDTLKIEKSNGKAVIYIDTEQAKHRQISNIKNSILARAGLQTEPDYFKSYNIRGLNTTEALQTLYDMLNLAQIKYGGIHLLLIDGVADFIGSVNDEESSIAIVKCLYNLANQFKMLVALVVHRNPGDNKVRGHLGSELLRKSESVIAIKKEGDNFYLEPEALRTASITDIPKFLFAYDKTKNYHCYTGNAAKEEKKDKFELLKEIVLPQMEDGKHYSRKELLTMVCQAMEVKIDMAQKMIKQLADFEHIEAVPNKKGFWIKITEATHPFGVQQNLEYQAA